MFGAFTRKTAETVSSTTTTTYFYLDVTESLPRVTFVRSRPVVLGAVSFFPIPTPVVDDIVNCIQT